MIFDKLIRRLCLWCSGVEFDEVEQRESQSLKLEKKEKNQIKIENEALLREICTQIKGTS
jgi:hypothetical protein